MFFEIYGFQITWKDWTKQRLSSIIKLIFCYQCKFAIFSILQRENEVSLRSRLLTFFWAAQQYNSYFFNDSAKDFFISFCDLKNFYDSVYINGNFLNLLVFNTGFYGGHNYKRAPYNAPCCTVGVTWVPREYRVVWRHLVLARRD